MATLEQIEDALRREAAAGNVENQQRLSDAMREHPTFQANAKRSLETGTYKMAPDGISELSKGEQRANMSKSIARSMGLGDDEVDVTRGMGTYGRFKLGFQPTEQDKVKHLEDTYGRENIRAIDVGGKMKLLYRDEQETGNQFRAVDEEGISLADFFGDVSGYVAPISAAVAGGAKGAAVGGAIGNVPGAIVGGALGAFGAATAAGTAQDIAVRAASGEEMQAGEAFQRRAKEEAINIPLDIMTGGLARGASKFVGARNITTAATEAKESLGRLLTKTEGDEAMLDIIPGSKGAAHKRMERLAREPEGFESSMVGRIHNEIDKIVDIAKGRVKSDVPVEKVIMDEANALRSRIHARNKELAMIKKEAPEAKRLGKAEKKQLTAETRDKLEADALEAAAKKEEAVNMTIDRMIRRQLKGAQRLKTDTGEAIRKSVLAGRDKDMGIVDNLYKDAERMIKAPIYRIRDKHSVEPIAKSYRRVMKKYNITDPTDDKAYRLLEARLGKSVADDLVTLHDDLAAGKTVNFSKLNSMTRNLSSKVNRRKTAGFTEDERVVNDLAKSMIKIRDKGLEQMGSAPREAWKKANREYMKRILPRTENITKRAGQMIAGGSDVAVDATKLADEALSSPQAIRQTIRSADNPTEMRNLLRGHYMTRIIDESGEKGIKISMDEIRPMYKNQRDANAAVDRLKRINHLIKNRKLSPDQVTDADIGKVMGDPLMPSSKRHLDLLERQSVLEDQASKDMFKSLKKMAAGQEPIIDDITSFIDEFVKLDARDIKQLMDKLPDEASRDSLRRSSLDRLLQMTESGGQVGSRRAGSNIIFNPETMLSKLKGKNAGKWKQALGEETYNDMIDAAEVLKVTPIPQRKFDEFGSPIVPKATVGGGAGLIFYATSPMRWLGRKTMDVMHGSGKISSMMEKITLDREVDEEFFKKLIIQTMGTRRGMEAVADEASKDKNFEEWMIQEIGGIEPEEPQEGF